MFDALLVLFTVLLVLISPSSVLSTDIPPYVPHQVKNYEYCVVGNPYEIQGIYVMNTMTSFEGILIGTPLEEVVCGEIHLMKKCNNETYPSDPPLDLCDYTNCPLSAMEPSLIAFHSSTPLPYRETCGIHLEIMAGEWSATYQMCQNLTMLTCVNFEVPGSG